MYEDVKIMPFKSGHTPIAVPSIGKTFADASYRIQKASEDNYAFEIIISGKGYIRTEKGLKSLSEGDLFISRPNVPRFYYADSADPFVKIWFIAMGKLPETILESHALHDTVYHAPDCLPIFENLFAVAKSGVTYEKVCRLTAKAILEIADNLCFSSITKTSAPAYLTEAKSYMDIHYTQRLTVENVAEYAHVSPSQLTRAFKKHYGETPYEYLLNLKLEGAKILLTTSRLSVKEISESLGFCDEHYFSMLFRKKTGLPPSKYHAD